ncbi:MAG: pilus assembly protein TadG-related protein [Chloroflexota bacterium]|nr:pilus assembly protein TadG-related protein [Chloroflexota bacterium]
MRQLERAQVTVFFALMLPVFLAVAGLALDGGRILEKHADLEAIADAAARAGAAAIDTSASGAFRNDPSSPPTLDPAAAEEAARAYADYEGVVPLAVTADASQVMVRVGERVPTVFLRVAHLDSVWIESRGIAHPRAGVSQAGN